MLMVHFDMPMMISRYFQSRLLMVKVSHDILSYWVHSWHCALLIFYGCKWTKTLRIQFNQFTLGNRWYSRIHFEHILHHINNMSARMFLSTDYLFEKRIWQVTSDLLYMRFTYYTKDNQWEAQQLILLVVFGRGWTASLVNDSRLLGLAY